MYLTKEETLIIYNSLPEGELKDKFHVALFKDDKLIETIKSSFKNLHSIWKSENENKYCVKFYVNPDDEDDEFKIGIATKIESSYGYDVEIDIVEIDIRNKDTENDWMYSSYELVWSSEK